MKQTPSNTVKQISLSRSKSCGRIRWKRAVVLSRRFARRIVDCGERRLANWKHSRKHSRRPTDWIILLLCWTRAPRCCGNDRLNCKIFASTGDNGRLESRAVGVIRMRHRLPTNFRRNLSIASCVRRQFAGVLPPPRGHCLSSVGDMPSHEFVGGVGRSLLRAARTICWHFRVAFAQRSTPVRSPPRFMSAMTAFSQRRLLGFCALNWSERKRIGDGRAGWWKVEEWAGDVAVSLSWRLTADGFGIVSCGGSRRMRPSVCRRRRSCTRASAAASFIGVFIHHQRRRPALLIGALKGFYWSYCAVV